MSRGVNNAVRIRRELLVEVARLTLENRLSDEIDRVPVRMFPRNANAVRCCVYKDRAVVKYRLMAMLGFSPEDETDESTPLAQYADEASARAHAAPAGPTVIDIACDECGPSTHVVTNACRGCMARPCVTACARGAVSFVDGHSVIDAERCVNCGLCAKECPYHAIIHRPVPCEVACPVGAVEKNEVGRVSINKDACIDCGRCLTACPFSAITERSQLVDVITTLRRGKPVVAALAPAIMGQFAAPFEQVVAAVRKLGFAAVHEVAAAADSVARSEAEEWVHRHAEGAMVMTNSCCPAYVRAVNRHVKELSNKVSDTESPMIRAARAIKSAQPQAVVVFVGPCLAKKAEAAGETAVDYVLSFEELGAWMVAAGIDVQECALEAAEAVGCTAGRGFQVSGGVSAALRAALAEMGAPEPDMRTINGLGREALRELKKLAKNTPATPTFVECMACSGGCIGGPLAYGSAAVAMRQLKKQGVAVPEPAVS